MLLLLTLSVGKKALITIQLQEEIGSTKLIKNPVDNIDGPRLAMMMREISAVASGIDKATIAARAAELIRLRKSVMPNVFHTGQSTIRIISTGPTSNFSWAASE